MANDDPECDGTDAAHPAWWRGEVHGTVMLCKIINDILDGNDKCLGACREPWESTRKRILALVQESEHKAIENLRNHWPQPSGNSEGI